MDKRIIINAKNNKNTYVYKKPDEMPEFQSNYGLWIFSHGENVLFPPRSKIKLRCFEFYGISCLIKGKGWYCSSDKQKKNVSVGDCIFTSPGFIHDYAGEDPYYIEDSICFTGTTADSLFKSGIIKNGIFSYGKKRMLLKIFNLLKGSSLNSQLKANFELQKALIDLFLDEDEKIKSSKYPQINYLLKEIQENPEKWWTSHQMAEICNLSESHFRFLFKKETGMKPKKYIDQFKVQYAIEQLCNSKNKVSDISQKMGYSDPYHFSRRFKELTGFSPMKYREHHSLEK